MCSYSYTDAYPAHKITHLVKFSIEIDRHTQSQVGIKICDVRVGQFIYI